MRTPSTITTITIATKNVATDASGLCVRTAAATVTKTAMAAFQNMGPPFVMTLSNRWCRSDDERVAFLAFDVERGARDGARGRLGEARIPRAAAVLHARDARGLVGPGLQEHRLAEVEQVAAAFVAAIVRDVPVVHEPGAGEGDGA